MRTALLLALAGCWSTKPASQSPNAGSATTEAATTASAPTGRPASFAPPTTGPAVVAAGKALVDPEQQRVAVHRNNGVDLLELATGKSVGRVELGWTGELWAMGPHHLIAVRVAGAQKIDAAVIDPVAGSRIACSGATTGPSGSQVSRVDVFTAKDTTYLKWETSPPPGPMRGGARVPDEEIEKMRVAFNAAYACGLFAVHVNGSSCTLGVATWQSAGLESCETRQMPWPRVMPPTVGDLALQVDHQSSSNAGALTETDTLIVTGHGSSWRTQVDQRVTLPPPP